MGQNHAENVDADPMRNSGMELVKSGVGTNEKIPLNESAIAMCAMTVECGFTITTTKSLAHLKIALGKILHTYKSLAGRVQVEPTGGKTVMVFNNEGVPFTDGGKIDKSAPDMQSPIPAEYFDLVSAGQVIGSDGNNGDPPMRIKVTQFLDEITLIALSISHGLVDASSIGVFMEDWMLSVEGLPSSRSPPIYDPSFFPALGKFGQSPLVGSEHIPESWKKVHRPFEMPKPAPYKPHCITYHRGKGYFDTRYGAFTDGEKLSKNDMLTGDVCEISQTGQCTLIMETRNILEQPNFFGCAILGLDFEAERPDQIPILIRKTLPELRTKEFVAWKLGQGPGKSGGVVMNSWVRAFDLNKIGAGSIKCHAVMLGEPFAKARGAMFSGYGVKYAIALPQRDDEGKLGSNFKVCYIGPKEVSDGLEGLQSVMDL